MTLDFAGEVSSGEYTASTGTIVIPAGSTTGSITLVSIDDALQEGGENITVSLATVTNALSGTPSSVNVGIIDDETIQVILTADTGSIAENGGVVTVDLALTGGVLTGDTIVTLSFLGTSTAGDYSVATGVVTILAGQTT